MALLLLHNFGKAGEIKGRSRSCLHVASSALKLKRGWVLGVRWDGGRRGGVRRRGALKMKMAHVAASRRGFFVDCRGGQSSSAWRGERRECAETRGTAVDLLIRRPTP